MNIPIGIVGTILESGDPALKIKVEFDEKGSGGYFIYQWRDGTAEFWDDWVQNGEELASYFEGQDWKICWEANWRLEGVACTVRLPSTN